MRSIRFSTNVPISRKLEIQLPADVPPGPAEVAVCVESEERQGGGTGTLGDLARSALCGIWADRADIRDSVQFARDLRRQAETRGRG